MAKSLIFEDAEKARNAITISQRKEISNLYVEWAKDIDELANYYKLKTTKSAPIVESQLRDLYKQIKQASDDVLKETQGVIVKNMYTMSKEMVDANAKWLNSIGFNVGDFDVAFSNVPKNVVERLVNGQIYDSSWSLSKSIWGDSQKTQKDLYTLVAKGVAQNKPIYDIAKDLERYVNPKKISRWNFEAKDGVKIYKKAVDYNSQRLARTLVQHSYQQSFIETTKHNPFVQKYKWVSNGSRVCDICLERDGKTYSKDELPMDHPNGMCTMEIVVSDTLTDDIANWINEPDGTYPDIDEFASNFGYDISKKQSSVMSLEEKINELKSLPQADRVRSTFKELNEDEYNDAIKGYALAMRYAEEKVIDLDKLTLYTVQPELIKTNLLEMSKLDLSGAEDKILIQKVGGKNIVMDGNHRTQLAILRGDKNIKVNYVDIDLIRKQRGK